MTAITTDSSAAAPRFALLRLVPLVLTHPVVFGLTVASIVFHQVCSIGSVVTSAVIVGQVATGTELAGIQG